MQWLLEHWPVIETSIFYIVSSFVAAFGAMGVTFKVFGERLIGHVFDRRLEDFKHERARDLEQFRHPLNQEIERLRGDIDHLLDRSKHSNEREYVALSMLWEKTVDLYFATNMCIAGLLEYPPLNVMPQEEVAEFLSTTELTDLQKRSVLKATDKERSFSHITGRRQINIAIDEFHLMNTMMHRQGIFVPTELYTAFEVFKEVCLRAIAQRRTEHGDTFRTGLKHDLEFLERGQSYFESVKTVVRKRLLRE